MQRGFVATPLGSQRTVERERLSDTFEPLLGARGLEQRLLLGPGQTQRVGDLASEPREVGLPEPTGVERSAVVDIRGGDRQEFAVDFRAMRASARLVAGHLA